MISSTTNIKIAIEYLHWIQSNLGMIQGLPDELYYDGDSGSAVPVDLPVGSYEFQQSYGLCDNILMSVLEYEDTVHMFLDCPECKSKTYPCGDHEDFVEDVNLYNNPKRLELIKHCIKYMQDVLEKRDAQED